MFSDVAAAVGGDSFQAADRDRPLIDTIASASRLARTITDAPENPRKYIRRAVEKIRVRESALGDESNIAGHIGVRRTGPLAIHNLVEVGRVGCVGRVQVSRISATKGAGCGLPSVISRQILYQVTVRDKFLRRIPATLPQKNT